MSLLTVKELIEFLKEEDPSSVIAIKNNKTFNLIKKIGFMQPESFLLKQPLMQDKFLLESEIEKNEKDKYIKAVILATSSSV